MLAACLLTLHGLAVQAVRNEAVDITYSYWDGAGHRRKISVRKGDTIEQFLGKVRDQLRPEFRELRWVQPHCLTDKPNQSPADFAPYVAVGGLTAW